MALRRKQQKLLGFGVRWQGAEPISALTRETEVQKALEGLTELYDSQRSVQDGVQAECAAVYDPQLHQAVLVRRRGQVVESFGRREDGKWILVAEEVLYLAERATLAVYLAAAEQEEGQEVAATPPSTSGSSSDVAGLRRLSIPELYRLILGVNTGAALPEQKGVLAEDSPALSLASYIVFAHLRRAGFGVFRSEEKHTKVISDESIDPGGAKANHVGVACGIGCWRLFEKSSAGAQALLPSVVHEVHAEDPFLNILGHLTHETVVQKSISETVTEALAGAAASEVPVVFALPGADDAGGGEVTFLELAKLPKPCRPNPFSPLPAPVGVKRGHTALETSVAEEPRHEEGVVSDARIGADVEAHPSPSEGVQDTSETDNLKSPTFQDYASMRQALRQKVAFLASEEAEAAKKMARLA